MIVKLSAPLKSYIWGGTKLKTEWNKHTELPSVAESWELSFVEGSESIISGGPFDGKKISEVATKKDFGKNCDKFAAFPTLIKLINSAQNLSVQVHPSDEYALCHEHQFGKTEMWYILDAEENAKIYLGLNKSMTARQFVQAVENGTVTNCLNALPVRKGETYFVESGTFHAIGAGITLMEIQQNSTLTYRVFDYGRVDKDGKPRELHLEKAMKVANLNRYEVPNPARNELLGQCKYFCTHRFCGDKELQKPNSFVSVTSVEKEIVVNGITLNKGETLFASAGERLKICADGEYIVTFVD